MWSRDPISFKIKKTRKYSDTRLDYEEKQNNKFDGFLDCLETSEDHKTVIDSES